MMPNVASISLVLKTERKANNLDLRYNKYGKNLSFSRATPLTEIQQFCSIMLIS